MIGVMLLCKDFFLSSLIMVTRFWGVGVHGYPEKKWDIIRIMIVILCSTHGGDC